jgi:hypothetical protein
MNQQPAARGASPNDKGPGRQSKPLDKHTITARKFSAKSTATEAQYERIVRMLRAGERSTFDCRRAGVMAPAARIKELNDKHAYYIPTVALRDLWDDEGFCHPRVAV